MQVPAYAIVKAFGIEALGKFYSFENADEISRARYEWAMVHDTEHTIKAFNDGNSIWEVKFNTDTMKAYRTDCGIDVTGDYQEQIGRLCVKLDRYSANFGLAGRFIMRFIKSRHG